MTREDGFEEQAGRYAEIVSLLEKNLRYLESLGMGEDTLRDYRRVLSHLRSRSQSEIGRILGGAAKTKPSTKTEPDLSDEEISRLKSDQIKRWLSKEKVTRVFLERLASIRFGVTKGALSALRSRESLVEKIQTLLANEGTHEAISQAASAQSDVKLSGRRESSG